MRTLEGITVVSLEQAVAAPLATRQLADWGARVIKVERPNVGDFARGYDDAVLGQSSYFVWLNRSKESLALDLKHPRGRQVISTLLAQADVLVQNLAPGAVQRLGLGVDQVRAAHPRLIVCDISGYGQRGAWATRKAYDLLVQGETGVVSLTGTPDEPSKVGVPIADIAAGMYAFSGILLALYRRSLTGEGSYVDISMFDAVAEWVSGPAYYARYSGVEPGRSGAEHATIAPYGPFETSDGGTILVAVQNEREWLALCEGLLGDVTLAVDERFVGNTARVRHREEVRRLVAGGLSALSTEAAEALLHDAGIATARLNPISAFLEHPVLAERDRWRDVRTPEGQVQALLPPALMGEDEPCMGPVPAVGEHSAAILTSLGVDARELRELETAGVVSCACGPAPGAERGHDPEEV